MSKQSLNNIIDKWLAARQWKLFLFGLPAVLVFGAFVLTTTIIFIHSANSYQRRYNYLAISMLSKGKFEEARVACLRGLSAAKNDQEVAQWLYYLAVALNGLGNTQQAQVLVRAAAPLDHPGFLQAHLMVARSLLSDTNLTSQAIQTAAANPTNAVAVQLHMAERQLLNALVLDPDSLDVNEALGRFYINTHQLAKSRFYLMKIFSEKPDTALLLAIGADLDNDAPSAISWSDRAMEAFQQNLVKSAPHYNYSDRVGLIQALAIKSKYMGESERQQRVAITNAVPQDSPVVWNWIVHLLLLKGKYAPAMATLDQQMQVNSNAVYSAAIGELCASWAQAIPANQPDASAARLRLVEKGLKNAPNNAPLQLLLVQISQGSDDAGKEAKDLLDQSLAAATGENAAFWEFILWTDARIRGDMVTARAHLQKAAKLAPDNPRIKNDLAFDLSLGSRADQERALQIIQSVVDKYPYDPAIRDTRGQILARLGRNQEAVTDLEYAVLRLPDPVETRRTLAKVYAALGMAPDKAAPDKLADARRLVKLDKFAEALDLLEKANLANPSPAFDSAIADACLSWLQILPPASPERVRLLAKGLASDPGNEELQEQAVQTTHLQGDVGRTAKKLVDQMVAASVGESAAQWHLFMGRDARSRGDLTAARGELQAAYNISPKSPQIQIELAGVLAFGSRSDVEQALQLIQPVVEKFPDDPNFLFTRGKIMVRLGRYQEALPDLEFAAPRLSDQQDARLQLATVYDALGKTKLAEEQRRLAKASKPL